MTIATVEVLCVAGETEIVRVAGEVCTVGEAQSETITVNVELIAVLATVPEKTPDDERAIPAGKPPELTVQV